MDAEKKWISLIAFAVVTGIQPQMARGQGIFGPGAAYLGAGVSRIGTDDLDERLSTRGYPTFGQNAVGVNVGAYHILPGGLTFGGEWHGLIIGQKDHEGREVGVGGGYGTFGMGYMVDLSRRVRIYPRIGVGGGGIGLWIQRDSVVDFDEVLIDPKPIPDRDREPVLSRVSVVMDLGVGAELLPGGIGRGLMIGLRLGYLAAPSSSDWQLYENEVTSGPRMTIGGPYVRAVIGIGRRR